MSGHSPYNRVWNRVANKAVKRALDKVPVVAAGWRRGIGCLKLQVSFRKRAANFRGLLRKMTFKDKVS